MNVKLISLTQPVIKIDGRIPTAEELIVYIARVSNPSNQNNLDTSDKLLKYCVEHEHWSIFEQVNMTVEIKTSRAIAAQLLRHKSFSFQEFSQRYAEVTEIEPVELRKQGKTNRQMSEEIVDSPYFANRIENLFLESLGLYEEMIEKGIARESARFVLPLTTKTTLYMTGSVRSWIHYLKVRLAQNTQKEHREVAQKIFYIFNDYFPTISQFVFLEAK
jgi:thymidylate synthase (FAD)